VNQVDLHNDCTKSTMRHSMLIDKENLR